MTQRDRIMISVVLLVVMLGGYWMLLLTPKRTAAKDAQAQVSTAQSALDTARSQLTSGQQAAESFRRDRATVVKLGRVVPGTDDPSTVLVQLEAIAKREKVSFNSLSVEASSAAANAPATDASTQTTTTTAGEAEAGMSTSAVAPLYPPGSVQVEGGLGRTAIKVVIVGPYFNIERYLRAIQRFAVLSERGRKTDGRLFIIDGIDYSTVPNEKNKNAPTELKADVSASVYFAPPIQAPTAPGGGATTTPDAAAAAGATSTPPAAIGSLR